MPLYIQQQPSKSLADRLFTAEFDDALVDQFTWKTPRYDGCKIISKEINKYTNFDGGNYKPIGGFQVGNFPVGVSGSFVHCPIC